jgi:hypothetical protein
VAHEGSEDFPAFVPEELPDQAQRGDDLFGIDTLSFAVGGPFFYRFAVCGDQEFSWRPGVENSDRRLAVAARANSFRFF